MSVLATAWAGPAAAAECALSAPAYGNVGTPLTIVGSGFPATSTIELTFTVDGTETDAFSVQSDADGGLQIELTPETVDLGATTVEARAGSTCAAEVAYTVLAAGATPPPAPEPEATAGAGGAPDAPPTDARAIAGSERGDGAILWLLAALLLSAGVAGLFLTRSAERR